MSKYKELKDAFAASTQTEWQVSPTLRPDLDDDPMCEYTLDNQKGYLTHRYFNADIGSDELDRVHKENRANAEFIALAHNKFSAIMEEIDRLQWLEAELHRVRDRASQLEAALDSSIEAMSQMREQIEQMRGLFDDDDSAIQEACNLHDAVNRQLADVLA